MNRKPNIAMGLIGGRTSMTESILAALGSLAAYGCSPPPERSSFSKLSEEAQEAIIWAVTSGEHETPPDLSEIVKDEIRQWASEPDAENAKHIHPDSTPKDHE